MILIDQPGCAFAGPRRGDCANFIGFPSPIHIPGMHDGPDDRVDHYGKANGWCWACWRAKQIEDLQAEVARLEEIIGL